MSLRLLGGISLSLPEAFARLCKRFTPPSASAVPKAIPATLIAMACVLLAGCSSASGVVEVPEPGDAQGAVYNATQRVWYDDAAGAFAEAMGGDALYVYEDVKSGAIEVSVSRLTVDLQGHELAVDAVGSGARGGQGLAHSGITFGTGEYAVSNGSISVSLGAQPETAQSAAEPYRGILAGQGGSLSLSGVSLNVAYSGTSTILPDVEVSGIEAGGSLAVENGSSVTVESAAAQGAFGASTASGIHATGSDAECRITLSDDSSVIVDNRSMQVMQGAIGYPTTVFGTTKTTNSELMEIAVDPSLDWYDDMCERFLANARYDDRADEDGFVYGAEVYYASPLELENGLNVWAFSDPMGPGLAGLPENIVPTHVFVRSDYALPLDAYGIWCHEEFAGTVTQEGAVSASTTLGHAIGVYESPAGTYEVDEGAIETSCGNGLFRGPAGSFDLGDYVDVPVGSDVKVSYPQQSSYVSVRQESPVAWDTAVAGEETWMYASQPIAFADLFTEWDLYGEAPEDDEETTVGLSLIYYRQGQDGYLYTGEEAGTYVYSPELDLIDVANERIMPGDIVEIGGVKNAFLGWSPRMSDKEPLYTDHILLEERNRGSFGAKCALYGIYEIVQEQTSAQGAADGQDDAAARATSSLATQSSQLPMGGLGAASAQGQADEAFSPAGGAVMLGCFALAVAVACLLWARRGRLLAALEAEAAGEEVASQEERKRRGGIRF